MFESKTPENIKTSILNAIDSDLSKMEGCFLSEMISPVCEEISKGYNSMEALQSMVWVDANSGLYLDYASTDIGIDPRKSGVMAESVLRIKGTPGHTVSRGTTFLTADNLCFDTLDDVFIPNDGVCAVNVRAQEIGAKYNVPVDAIIYPFVSSSKILEVTNEVPAMGGAAPESDKSLYERIKAARMRPGSSGNVYHYMDWALEVLGVGSVRIFPLQHGPGICRCTDRRSKQTAG